MKGCQKCHDQGKVYHMDQNTAFVELCDCAFAKTQQEKAEEKGAQLRALIQSKIEEHEGLL